MKDYQVIDEKDKVALFDTIEDALSYQTLKKAVGVDSLLYQKINGAWVYQQWTGTTDGLGVLYGRTYPVNITIFIME